MALLYEHLFHVALGLPAAASESQAFAARAAAAQQAFRMPWVARHAPNQVRQVHDNATAAKARCQRVVSAYLYCNSTTRRLPACAWIWPHAQKRNAQLLPSSKG